ncbi:biopolymer transporter ExbD [Aquimarina sp. BL5]|uniref:ExbD/TolR family protein n=1 Tax=Aquimarina sp. BL5 TaxID=1714860 RepID=UPI000E4858AA|nr:biopolymer transporter ExbD [Aquimarina sp. BL5]AXT51492.1 biopolymer transporter ExbD [Aquimarina sp. BL5]RKN06939.1 biopolymer transporter ExbD [Aquimarina sp. BL5]
MSIFKKKPKTELPAISTASLPDIVFMLLFFFMVATVMRNDTLIVKNELPYADQIEKLERKNMVIHIYAGKPSSRYKNVGTEAKIQLNDKFASIHEVRSFVLEEIKSKPEELRPFLTTAIKVDKDTKMGLVGDVKKELRAVHMLKINYITKRGQASNNLQ